MGCLISIEAEPTALVKYIYVNSHNSHQILYPCASAESGSTPTVNRKAEQGFVPKINPYFCTGGLWQNDFS
ncbi:hypothetical protein J22TS3_22060 [Paenibacillus sp. J22TS3]|nr:hypothetical protein J22TS3_22060 [Paenibacillus sp. J22TS3]